MFKTYNIPMDKADTVLTNMCHLYEVGEADAEETGIGMPASVGMPASERACK
jgi:hypothetical protein